MAAFMLAIAIFTPQPDNLGCGQWHERERWTAIYSNEISARILPIRSDDPEIDYRLRQLRTVALGHRCERRIEQLTRRTDINRWLWLYVIESDTVAYTLEEVYNDLHTDYELATRYLEQWPSHVENRGWLFGIFLPEEYDIWRNHVYYHRHRWVSYPALAIARGAR